MIVLYTLISVFIVSLISLIGVFTLGIKIEKLKKILIYIVSFSTGALFGDAFIHIIPEISRKGGFGLTASVFLLLGILIFFILEKVISWNHCHIPISKEHIHNFTYMALFGDILHNFIDGLIIAASYIASIELGLATTLAVAFHEIPHEMGNFGILIHGGFGKGKALLVNFLSALTAVLGAVIALVLAGMTGKIEIPLLAIAAGGFIYIAGSDLIPELHKHFGGKESLLQIVAFVLGILIMLLLLIWG